MKDQLEINIQELDAAIKTAFGGLEKTVSEAFAEIAERYQTEIATVLAHIRKTDSQVEARRRSADDLRKKRKELFKHRGKR